MKKGSILYIDDENKNLKAFKRSFGRDYDVYIANSAQEGEKLLHTHDVHIILSDQKMPLVTGTQFLSAALTLYPEPIRILITAYADMEVLVEGINEAGIYKYIQKPYDKDYLTAVFNEALLLYQKKKTRKEKSNHLEGMFNASENPIFITDTKGVFLEVNPAFLQLFQFSKEETLGQHFNQIAADNHSAFESILAHYSADSCEFSFKAKTGNIMACMLSFSAFLDVGYQGSIKNISVYNAQKNKALRNILDDYERFKEHTSRSLLEGVAQNIAGVKFYLSRLKKTDSNNQTTTINYINQVLEESIEELKTISHQLMPQSFALNSVESSLQELVVKKAKAHHLSPIKVYVKTDVLSKEMHLVVYRFFNDMLQFLIQHRLVSVLSLFLQQEDNKMIMLIKNEFTNAKPSSFDVEKTNDWLLLKLRIRIYGGRVKASIYKNREEYQISFPYAKD